MKRTKVFDIEGKFIELPLFEKGDRVTIKDNYTKAINPVGTVIGIRDDGLSIDIAWDVNFFESKEKKQYIRNYTNENLVTLGKKWRVDSVKLLND